MRSYPADGYMSVVAYIQNHTFYNSHVPAGQMPPTPIAIAVHPTHLGFGSSCFPSHRAPSHPVAGFAAPNLAQIFRSSSGDIIFFVIPPIPVGFWQFWSYSVMCSLLPSVQRHGCLKSKYRKMHF